MFAIFGAVLSVTGGAQTFIRLGQKATGKSIGGPGKVTIVSSGLFGMISGSAMANVVATGTFTIPLMKAAGYAPDWAAAISAMGSTGGQIMPPIMGSAAFIMAQILGVNYIVVAIAAVVPAILYYYGAFVAVHYVSKRDNIRGQAIHDRISISDLLAIFVPIIIFLFYLMRGYSVTNAAFYSTIGSLIVCFVVYASADRSIYAAAKKSGSIVYKTAMGGASSIIDMATLLAGAQITISLISMTGFGVKLSDLIISIGQNNLFLCLVLSMSVCILLGMGLPTTAAYVLAAAILVPALNQLGLELFYAHMFVVYFSALATITPPVCAAVYLASGIAESNWIRTGLLAVLIALPGFVVPYTFVYNPALLLRGDMVNILIAIVTALIGVFFIGVAIAGYVNKPVPMFMRVLFVCGGVALIVPDVMVSAIGLAICVGLFVFLRVSRNTITTP
jgi:TRAP transporter 4TM/12TM fusion protein